MMFNEDGQIYWTIPDPDINEIGIWGESMLEIGYKTKMGVPENGFPMDVDLCLPIYGPYFQGETTFTLTGPFTFLPVLSNDTVVIADLFGTNTEKVLAIYEWKSSKVWSKAATNPDFTAITPGKAYLCIADIQNGYTLDFDVDFPANNLALPIYFNNTIETDEGFSTPWNEVINTSVPHIVYLGENITNQLQTNDVIGVFNQDGLCVGVKQFDGSVKDLMLVAMGNDELVEEITGLISDEELTYKLFRPETNEQFDILFTYDPNYTGGNFVENGFSKITGMTMSVTSTSNINGTYNLDVFPNPATDVVNIVTDYTIQTVTIVNYVGQAVLEQNVNGGEAQIDVTGFETGIYFLRIETIDGKVFTRKVAIK
jgi:hypothetical protein